MKRTSNQFRKWFPRGCVESGLLALCVFVLVLGGCAERQAKAKTFPWNASAHMRPLPPEEQTQDDASEPLGDAQLEIAPPPSTLVAARSVPARPRAPAAASPQNEAPTKTDVPQLAPQLSAAETSAAQQETNQSLGIAERNIGASAGKTLNAAQQDLASKVRGFIAEARDAAHAGDWMRARNAAKKAEVLSQELAGSL
jgi:hypothetical protein